MALFISAAADYRQRKDRLRNIAAYGLPRRGFLCRLPTRWQGNRHLHWRSLLNVLKHTIPFGAPPHVPEVAGLRGCRWV